MAGDDCPLPISQQNQNIARFVIFWAIYYLAAPVSYVGLTHANLLKELGNNDKINNLPAAIYMWMAPVPVLMAWFLPQPKYLKPLAVLSIASMIAITMLVAYTLSSGASAT